MAEECREGPIGPWKYAAGQGGLPQTVNFYIPEMWSSTAIWMYFSQFCTKQPEISMAGECRQGPIGPWKYAAGQGGLPQLV